MFNSVNFFTKIIRPIAAALDKLIYGLIGWILSGILELSNLMTSETFAQTIYKNIYILLAVFMVFKLTFSFIQYLVSPDKMLDKDQGVGKLITNTIVMLLMLILLPIIFYNIDLIHYKSFHLLSMFYLPTYYPIHYSHSSFPLTVSALQPCTHSNS